jgi:dihydroorotate dehydrogenase electron transfer subunit
MPDAAASDKLAAIDARVVARRPICRRHVALDVVLPEFPDSAPGQFVQLRCGNADETGPRLIDWHAGELPRLPNWPWQERQVFLRRPFSIGDRWTDDRGNAHLLIISRSVGPGTAWLDRLQPGDALNLTGPLGRGFLLPVEPTPIALVGGGVGIPPLLYAARRLHDLNYTDVTAIFGATTADLLPVQLSGQPAADGTARPCINLPGAAPFPAIVTTDDGSLGLPGHATDGLKVWHTSRDRGSPTPLVLACGPEAMLRAVTEHTRQHGLNCQLCIERNMGCGLGTCLSCLVRVGDDARPGGWRWALACTDGPVFLRDELFDYNTPATG